MSSGFKEARERVPRGKDYIGFVEGIGSSKRIPRTGWVMVGIKNPESVADHSHGVTVLAMAFADELGVDPEKIKNMAIVHDIGEIYTGDIVVQRGPIIDISRREEKERAEREGIIKFFGMIGKVDYYVALFDEMVARVTRESQVFWQLDKLDMANQAFLYEREQGIKLDEFFESADLGIKEPSLRERFNVLQMSRKRRGEKSNRPK